MMLHVGPAAHVFVRARGMRGEWAAAQAATGYVGGEASAFRG